MLYAIAIETIGSPEFTCKDENENPHLYKSETDAWKEIADDMIIELEAFRSGRVEKDYAPFEGTDEFVVAVKIEDGKIIAVSDEVDEHVINGSESDLTINEDSSKK